MTTKRPIDMTVELPLGCVCTRECWDRLLEMNEEMETTGESVATWHCGIHGVQHLFEHTPIGTLIDHPDCILEE